MNEDFRRHKRRKPNINIIAIDCMTQQPIGTVSDLSELGMMVSASNALTTDGLYQIELNFPKNDPNFKSIKVGAQELWSVQDAETNKLDIGFRFIDIAPNDRLRLSQWVNEPGSLYV